MKKQVVQRFNVSVPKQYTNTQGEQKIQWLTIGTAVQFDDGSIMQTINTLPTGSWWDGSCQLFKQEARTTQAQGAPVQQQTYQAPQAQTYPAPQPQPYQAPGFNPNTPPF